MANSKVVWRNRRETCDIFYKTISYYLENDSFKKTQNPLDATLLEVDACHYTFVKTERVCTAGTKP